MTTRRAFIRAISGIPLTVPLTVYGQEDTRVRTIGFLGVSRNIDASFGLTAQLIAALRELGWSEGRNVAFLFRWTEQHNDLLPALARELVAANVDVIVVGSGATGTRAAMQASDRIPIVMTSVADPVKFGLIASFAHPGGNVTGLAQPLVDWGKWLELAREGVSGATRIAIIGNSTNIVYSDYVRDNEAAAKRLGLELQMLPVARFEDFGPAFAAMKRAGASALVFGPDALFLANLDYLVRTATENRLPVIAPARRAAELGAVISYGADFTTAYRRAAVYVDKILRGARPADLPVEQPARFELVINLGAARALGLTMPQGLLVRADEVIQ